MCYNRWPMRILLFLPVTYIAGEHGFVFFAPYLAFVMITLHVARRVSASRAARAARAVPVPAGRRQARPIDVGPDAVPAGAALQA